MKHNISYGTLVIARQRSIPEFQIFLWIFLIVVVTVTVVISSTEAKSSMARFKSLPDIRRTIGHSQQEGTHRLGHLVICIEVGNVYSNL